MARVLRLLVAALLLVGYGIAGPASRAVAAPTVPEAVPIARWPLNGATSDVVGGHHLVLPGVVATDYDWVDDRACRPESALNLHGTAEAYAATAGPVVETDESFSVAAWVAPGTAAVDQTVLSQAGVNRPAVLLQQTAEDGWRFALSNLSAVRPGSGVAETVPGSVLHGVWNHVAGVVDLPDGEVRLYVNGELAGTGALPASSWPARGSFYLGVAGTMRTVGSPFIGIIDSVDVWSGRLLASQIEAMGRTGGLGPVDCF
jgi:concanavalin A-like lectin/glucanase superfamily protein